VKKRVNSPYCRSTRRKFSSFSSFDGALTVLICDVSGHGIGSALMANRIYSEALHQLELKASPGNSLRHLHDFVHDRLATDAFYFTWPQSIHKPRTSRDFCCRRPSTCNARLK
jgi:serine phosphatase RsbU (regulator of sigma subunit)